MRKSLLDILYNYVNTDLREDLKFREKYSYPKYFADEYTLFFYKINEDQPDDLKNIMISSPEIVSQVKQIFMDFFDANVNNVDKVNLIFGDEGFGIKFSRGTPTSLKIDSYADIISNLSNVEEVNRFCRSSKELVEVCKNEDLWRSLVTRLYNFQFKYDYNYEKLYKGILIYNTYRIDKQTGYPYVENVSEFDKMSELIRFFFKEGIVKSTGYAPFIDAAVQIGDEEVIDMIYRYYKGIDKVSELIRTILIILRESIRYGNVKSTRNLLNIVYPKMKGDISEEMMISYMILPVHTHNERVSHYTILPDRPFDEKMYNLIMANFKFEKKSNLIKFNDDVIGSFIRYINPGLDSNFVDRILSSGNWSPAGIIAMATDYQKNRDHTFPFHIMKRIKSYMNEKDIEDLNNATMGFVPLKVPFRKIKF